MDTPIRKKGGVWRHFNKAGYVIIEVPLGTAGAFKNPAWKKCGKAMMLEHRYVMQQWLGRPLLTHESPHHINGDRADNRLENLELWSSSQPPGQRIADKIAFAMEMLALYPMFVGLDLVDQATLRSIAIKIKKDQAATRIRY